MPKKKKTARRRYTTRETRRRSQAVKRALQIGRSREQRLFRPVEAAPPLLQQPLALLCESRAEPFQSDRRRMRDRQRRIS